MMRKLFLTLLSLVLAFGGESPALDVTARHLEAYRQQRKACGDEDELATLRLKANYIRLKSWIALETDDDAFVQAQKELLDLRERAYLLAKARYEQGLASLRDVYETGAELYAMTEHTEKVHPTLAEMKAMYSPLDILSFRQKMAPNTTTSMICRPVSTSEEAQKRLITLPRRTQRPVYSSLCFSKRSLS